MIAKAYRSCSGRSSGCAVITSDAVRNLMHHVCYSQFPNGKVLLQVFGQYFMIVLRSDFRCRALIWICTGLI
jgi:hypothetical protein